MRRQSSILNEDKNDDFYGENTTNIKTDSKHGIIYPDIP